MGKGRNDVGGVEHTVCTVQSAQLWHSMLAVRRRAEQAFMPWHYSGTISAVQFQSSSTGSSHTGAGQYKATMMAWHSATS